VVTSSHYQLSSRLDTALLFTRILAPDLLSTASTKLARYKLASKLALPACGPSCTYSGTDSTCWARLWAPLRLCARGVTSLLHHRVWSSLQAPVHTTAFAKVGHGHWACLTQLCCWVAPGKTSSRHCLVIPAACRFSLTAWWGLSAC